MTVTTIAAFTRDTDGVEFIFTREGQYPTFPFEVREYDWDPIDETRRYGLIEYYSTKAQALDVFEGDYVQPWMQHLREESNA